MNKLIISQRATLVGSDHIGYQAIQARELVYHLLFDQGDYSTIEEIFLHVKAMLCRIVLRIMHKVFELLVATRLVWHAVFECEPVHYYSNIQERAHNLKEQFLSILPRGFRIASIKIIFERVTAHPITL